MKALQSNETDKRVDSHQKLTRIQSANQEKILTAALGEFSRFGFRGTTVDQIAEKSGMSKANILYYFKRKNDIYIAVLERILEHWLEPLQALDPSGDPAEELWRYMETKIQLSRQSPEASRLFATEILQGAPLIKPFLENELKDVVDEKCSVLKRWIAEGKLVDASPLHLIFMIWAATQHYADFATQIEALSDADEDETYRKAEKTLRQVLLRGMLATPPAH